MIRALLPLVVLAAPAWANGAPTPPPSPALQAILEMPPDLEYGAFLAQECAACHRADAPAGAAPIPAIAGLEAAYLAQALYDYRAGTRANPVMQTIARSLDDDMIAALAAPFAAQAE